MAALPTSSPAADVTRARWLVISTLALTVFVTTSNGASLGAFIPELAEDFNVSVPLLGQISTVTFMVTALISLVTGPLADNYGKRRMIQYGLMLMVGAACGSALAPSYGWFLMARVVTALSAGFIVGNTLALTAAIYDGDERRRALSWVTAGTASAPIVGVPLLTMLASVSSWRGAYLAVAVASLAVVAVLRLWVLDDTQSRAERFTPASLLSAYQPLLRSHSMLRILSASTLRATSWVALLTYLGAFLGDTLDLGVREIGWAYMLGGAGYFAGTKLAGMRLGGVSLHALYGSSTLAMGTLVAMALLLPSSGFQIAIALVVASACSGIGWVTLVTLLMDETPAGQASTMSLNAVVFSIGASVGTLTGGGLLTFGGYAALGIGLLVFSAASSVLVWQPAHLSAESS